MDPQEQLNQQQQVIAIRESLLLCELVSEILTAGDLVAIGNEASSDGRGHQTAGNYISKQLKKFILSPWTDCRGRRWMS